MMKWKLCLWLKWLVFFYSVSIFLKCKIKKKSFLVQPLKVKLSVIKIMILFLSLLYPIFFAVCSLMDLWCSTLMIQSGFCIDLLSVVTKPGSRICWKWLWPESLDNLRVWRAAALTCSRGWWPLSGARRQSWMPVASPRHTGGWRPVHSPRCSWSAAGTAPAAWNPAADTRARWCCSAQRTPYRAFLPPQLCVDKR